MTCAVGPIEDPCFESQMSLETGEFFGSVGWGLKPPDSYPYPHYANRLNTRWCNTLEEARDELVVISSGIPALKGFIQE